MADWIERPIHEAIYATLQNIAHLTWGLDRSGLYIINLLDNFRLGLVTTGLTTALDVVAEDVIGLSRPLVELALVMFALLLISAPAITLKWVDIRKALLYLVLLPILLPTLVAGFQDADRVRGDFGTTVYNTIFSRTSQGTFNMIPDDEQTGVDRDILLENGQIPQFAPRADGVQGIRGVDVAASYLYARRSDVINPSQDLPVAFQDAYFPYTVSEFGSTLGPEDRWEAIATGADGIVRTLYGIILVTFAGFETLIDLGFSLTFGLLAVAAILALLVSWMLPFEGIFAGILRKIVDLFLQSWGVATIQALLLAAIVDVGNTGGGIAVLGAGILGLFIECLFVLIAYKAVIGAVTGFGTASGLSPMEARGVMGRFRAPVSGTLDTARRGVGAAFGGALAVPAAVATYAGARAQGATATFARGYAMQTMPRLATMGNLAAVMGGNREFLAGAAQGQMAQKRDYGQLSPMGMDGVGRHVDQQTRLAQTDERHATQEERYQARETQQTADRTQREERYQSSEARRAEEQPQREAERVRREQERQAREAQQAREAPIKAINRGQIAEQVATAYASAHLRDPATPASVDDVSSGLGLAPGAFGRSTPAVQAVLQDLQQTPLAPDLAQRLMVEATQEGRFRPDTRAEAHGDLVASGMPEPAASSRLTAMQGHMQKLPTSVRVDDALSAAAVSQQSSGFAGFSAEHRATPAAPGDPIVTPYTRPAFPTPPEPVNYDRQALPAPPPPAPRPRALGRPRPRSAGGRRPGSPPPLEE